MLARRADDFVESVGVNVHLHYLDTQYGQFDRLKAQLGECGIRYVRDQSVYDGLATPNTQWVDQLQRERFSELYADVGVRVNLIFESRYADRQHWVPTATALGPALAAAEGINEVDVGSSYAAAVEQQAWLYEDLGGTVPVLGPSWVGWSSRLSGQIRSGIVPNCDLGNFHPYQWSTGPNEPGHPAAWIDGAISDWTAAFGGRGLVATEEGWPTSSTSRGESERVQAKYALRTFLENYNRGVVRTYWYELLDQKNTPSNDEHNFGFVRHDGTPKPSFDAVKSLLGLFGPPPHTLGSFDYTLSGETDAVGDLLLQDSDHLYLVLWGREGDGPFERSTDNDTIRRVYVDLPQPVDAASYLPLDGGAVPVDQATDLPALKLNVPDHPLVVQLTPKQVKVVPPRTLHYEIVEVSQHRGTANTYVRVKFWDNALRSGQPVLVNDFLMQNVTDKQQILDNIETYARRAISRGDDTSQRQGFDQPERFVRDPKGGTLPALVGEKREVTG